MSRLITRNPFSRTELHRATVARGICPNCGQDAKFRYYAETDSGRTITARTPLSGILRDQPFCSISCYRSYNN